MTSLIKITEHSFRCQQTSVLIIRTTLVLFCSFCESILFRPIGCTTFHHVDCGVFLAHFVTDID